MSEPMSAADAAAQWRAYAEPLVDLIKPFQAIDLKDWTAQEWHELYRQLMSGLSMGYMGLFLSDKSHPDFWPLVHQAWNYWVPNPDSTYYCAPIDGNGRYLLSGYRGSVRTVDVQIGSGRLFTHGDSAPGPNLASHDLDELKIDEDGAFEVLLSAERLAGHSGDWWALGPTASYILVRQTAYDWHREVDGRLAIERLDVPAARPRPDLETISQALRNLPGWAQNWTRGGLQWTHSYRDQDYVNKVFVRDLVAVGGVGNQFYIEGEFAIGEDEALIYETELPKQCRYWNVQLTDMLWGALDYTHCHTSINGHNAQLDADGKFRAVIAARDPGVPNWLDTLGYTRGAILGRWTQVSEAPVPSLKKVKFDELRRHLPAETPTVTPEQRDASLRLRRRGLQLRRRW